MTIRALVLIAGVLVAGPAPLTRASAADWRFVKVYRSLGACQGAGQSLVGRRQAREYRCENDYDKAGVPLLDLYVR
ncbi:MAG TPA: hypothetical protein VGD53_08740 [Actinoallomurus sp.]|jgi:hypothetical protein